ncbi:MAG: hypothetical protein IID45_08400 [Planctomycetes bacterium]|nr:hypothetical protein [Planctomycetota bacterium]
MRTITDGAKMTENQTPLFVSVVPIRQIERQRTDFPDFRALTALFSDYGDKEKNGVKA